jgi:hypothetical protein
VSRVDRTGHVAPAGKGGRHRGAGGGLTVKFGRRCTESGSYPCSMDYGARAAIVYKHAIPCMRGNH